MNDAAPKTGARGIVRAHMATFPARLNILHRSLSRIAPQVDKLFLCLNDYEEPPAFLSEFENVHAVIPPEDQKDVGKFIFKPAPEDIVFLVDDDIEYSEKYVRGTLRRARNLGLENRAFGYHASIFPSKELQTVRNRQITPMNMRVGQPFRVHQLGTGTVMLSGSIFPSLDFMAGSQMFVDVRFARYCCEHGIELWTLPRTKRNFPSLLSELEPEDRGTIARNFTRRWPGHVLDEVASYAGTPL